MSLYLHFVLSFGALLALIGVIAAWLFRTASAPFWVKVLIPSAAVALGCYAPFAVAEMMGFPVTAAMSALPDKAELLAFVAHDEDSRVDLWLRSSTGPGSPSGGEPRAYETRLTAQMKKTLEAAREAQARGQIAMLTKRGGKRTRGAGDPLGIGDDQDLYVLDPSALSSLPPKK